MNTSPAHSSVCLILTATIRVKEDMVFTARREGSVRLNDYKKSLALWLAHPEITSLVLVENSGSDLSELREVAARTPEKNVEFLSFVAPEFDGALGKGYGEMICLQYMAEHSQLLAKSSRFVKVTGRYFLTNTTEFLRFIESRRDADVICDLLWQLTWADSRAFAASKEFLQKYLFPLREEIDDSRGSNFEHVLARAAHACMADRGIWAAPSFPLELQGISGSQNRGWQMSLTSKVKLRLRYTLLTRILSAGPQ